MNSIRMLLFGATALLTSCAGSDSGPSTPTAPTPPAGSATVHAFGRALDFTTGAGVAGASIDFYIQGLPTIASSVITDGGGRYSVSLSRGVTYNPRINGPDVDSNRGTIVPVAKDTETDFLINSPTCIVFYGTVRDALRGEPLAGAAVGFDRFATQSTQTGDNGSYRIELGCPTPANPWRATGTTFMSVSRDGYVTASPYGNRSEFLPSARTQRIDVALQPL